MSDAELQRLRRDVVASNDPAELRRLAFMLEREGLALAEAAQVDRMESGTSGTGAPKDLLKALRDLQKQYGDDAMDRAWAQRMIAARWRSWRSQGLKWGSGCPLMLTQEHSEDEHGDYSECKPPGTDHPRMWFRRGKPVVFTMQPYSLYGDEVPGLVDYCRRHRLTVSILASRCWYFPGSSILVELRPEKTDDQKTAMKVVRRRRSRRA